MRLLQVSAIGVSLAVCAVIPFVADAEYIASRGLATVIPAHVIFNDLYVFSWGLLMYRIVKSTEKRAIVLGIMAVAFLLIHFVVYAPMFPEFYWS